jgi:hypothetical protein
MSKSTNRDTTANATDSVENRLTRLLDSGVLARVVPHLAPETLHQLIRYKGLEACGELLTNATPAQLTSLLDLDLWRHPQAGRDEEFDVERFGAWLEVLVDAGESAAAATVARLDPSLVIAGLSRYLRLFDPGTFEPTESSDDEAMDRHGKMNSETPADVAECEVGGYLVRARRTDAWDAIITLLTALETEHSEYFHGVMRGCRRLSNSTPEIDGLDDLLLEPEQQLLDVTIEREQRRTRRGYATPADARAFLQMARQTAPPDGSAFTAPLATNPIAAAYFRSSAEAEDENDTPTTDDVTATSASAGEDVRASVEAVVKLLDEAGVLPERPRALLESGPDEKTTTPYPLLRRFMDGVQLHDAEYFRRHHELGFLANTLLAGCSVQSRPFTEREAADAAASICNLGLECLAGTATLPETFLVDHDLVRVFEAGWSVLYRDVSLFVADQLLSTLGLIRSLDADVNRELRVLRRELTTQRAAGTPWLARGAADVLGMLDPAASVSVLGLLDECPIIPAALTAVLERLTTPVSPHAFAFISTTAQIGDVRVFMRTLPGLLSG